MGGGKGKRRWRRRGGGENEGEEEEVVKEEAVPSYVHVLSLTFKLVYLVTDHCYTGSN